MVKHTQLIQTIVDFEQVIVSWVWLETHNPINQIHVQSQ